MPASTPRAGWIGFLALALAVGLALPAPSQPVCGYQVVHSYPHDPGAFTEGLLYDDGYLYESTGLTGQSTLRRVVLETGAVEQSVDLDAQYFGEGLALFGSHLIQLTYTSGLAFGTIRHLRPVDQHTYLATVGAATGAGDERRSSTQLFRDPRPSPRLDGYRLNGGPQGSSTS
jgi:glutamine cyclotransferase